MQFEVAYSAVVIIAIVFLFSYLTLFVSFSFWADLFSKCFGVSEDPLKLVKKSQDNRESNEEEMQINRKIKDYETQLAQSKVKKDSEKVVFSEVSETLKTLKDDKLRFHRDNLLNDLSKGAVLAIDINMKKNRGTVNPVIEKSSKRSSNISSAEIDYNNSRMDITRASNIRNKEKELQDEEFNLSLQADLEMLNAEIVFQASPQSDSAIDNQLMNEPVLSNHEKFRLKMLEAKEFEVIVSTLTL